MTNSELLLVLVGTFVAGFCLGEASSAHRNIVRLGRFIDGAKGRDK